MSDFIAPITMGNINVKSVPWSVNVVIVDKWQARCLSISRNIHASSVNIVLVHPFYVLHFSYNSNNQYAVLCYSLYFECVHCCKWTVAIQYDINRLVYTTWLPKSPRREIGQKLAYCYYKLFVKCT